MRRPAWEVETNCKKTLSLLLGSLPGGGDGTGGMNDGEGAIGWRLSQPLCSLGPQDTTPVEPGY